MIDNPFATVGDPGHEMMADLQRALRLLDSADAVWLVELVLAVRDLQRKAGPGIPHSRRKAMQAERRLDNFLHEWKEAKETPPFTLLAKEEGGA